MNWSKNLQLKISAILIVLASIGLLIYSFYDNAEVSKMAKNSYEHKIVGKISAIFMVHSRIDVKLENDDNTYDFSQQQDSYKKKPFYKNVQAGDSILKNAFSDTIFVKRDGITSIFIIDQPK